MPEPGRDLPLRLREALSETHRVIENLPLAVALTDGTVTRETYVRLLEQLLHLHESLENALDRATALSSVFEEGQRRAPTLRNDLAALGADPETRSPPVSETERLRLSFERWAERDPWRLAGALFVFEGSRMGSLFIGPAVAKALRLSNQPGSGVDYHLDGAAERPQAWKAFKTRLAETADRAGSGDAVIAGAVETMSGLTALYAALGPSEPLVAAPKWISAESTSEKAAAR